MATVSPQSNAEENYQEITGKTYILTLLQRLVQQRLLVTASLPGHKAHFTTTVLAIESHAGYLLLDQLFPQKGQQPQVSEKLHIYADLGGATLGFATSLISLEHNSGLVYYRFSLPQSVSYLQRRDGHRVLAETFNIPVELIGDQGKVYKGKLHDISSAGMGIQLAKAGGLEDKATYHVGIYPAGEEPIQAELETCGSREEGKDVTIVGGLFVALDKRTEQTLARLVAELERRCLRSRWNPHAAADKSDSIK